MIRRDRFLHVDQIPYPVAGHTAYLNVFHPDVAEQLKHAIENATDETKIVFIDNEMDLKSYLEREKLTHPVVSEVNGFKIYHDEANGEYYFRAEEINWTFADERLWTVEDVARNYPRDKEEER